MTHDDLEALVPLLALDALPPAEERTVRAHVATCPTCTALLGEHARTAADLALLAHPVAPPASLRAGVLAALDEPAGVERNGAGTPAPAVSGGDEAPRLVAVPTTAAARHGAPSAPGGAQRTPTAPGGADRTPAPGRIRPGWWHHVAVAVAAAACLMVGIAYFSYDAAVDTAARKDAVIARQREALALVAGQPALTMAATDGSARAGRVHVQGDRAAVVLLGLEEAGTGVWEVWAIRGGVPSPLATVTASDFVEHPGAPGGSRAVVLVERGAAGLEGAAVSLEPDVPPADATAPAGPVVLASS